MAKSRVAKNKSLYDVLEKDNFELEDITSSSKKAVKKEEKIEEETKIEEPVKEEVVSKEPAKEIVKVEEKKQELVPVKKKEKKNEVVVVEKKKKQVEEDFVVEQPISYTDRLSVEEVLRAKLEEQQRLKDSKKNYKKTPFEKNYTPEMMQKNINQSEGVDVRKEVNIRVRKGNNGAVAGLVLLLVAILAATAVIIYTIW